MKTLIRKAAAAATAIAAALTLMIADPSETVNAAAADITHSHKACGGTAHDGCTHEDIEYEPYPDNVTGPFLRGKSYYLTKDIELGSLERIFVQDGVSNLCLNGHSITKANTQIIDINQINNVTAGLNICDCVGGGIIKNTSDVSGYACVSVIDDVEFNLYGGTIDGGKQGGGIFIERTDGYKSGTANIYGGTVRAEDNSAIWLVDPDTTISIYGGEISSSKYHTIFVGGERSAVSIYGGKIIGSAPQDSQYNAIQMRGEDATVAINGGEVISENCAAVSCHVGELKITDGEVKSEGTSASCVRNWGNLIVSGGAVSCKGVGIYNYDGGVFEISGGEITSESAAGISNKSALTISGGIVSGDFAVRNFGSGATATISGGEVSCKGNYGIYNYNGGTLNITGGKVSGGQYCLYNQEGMIAVSGGTVNAQSYYALYNEAKGSAVISGGTLRSTFSPITNYGTLNISGGSFGAADPSAAVYIINHKLLNLSGSPVFGSACLWLKTNDNTEITGELSLSEPCLVYIESAMPRIFTSGWNGHMGDKDPSTCFKSPYSSCTIAEKNGEAVIRYFMLTFNANGGTCDTSDVSVNNDGKASVLPSATREGYSFDGWFTTEDGGDKVTGDTVFDSDTTLYAHWTLTHAHDWQDTEIIKAPGCTEGGKTLQTCTICKETQTINTSSLGGHTFSDTWEYDENNHYHLCTVCRKGWKDIASHTWDNGTVTKQPTEESKGVKTFTCTVCGAVKTEELGKTPHEHKFSADWTSDETGHWHAAACGHDAAADWEEHRLNGEWQKTDEQHWKICAVCHAEIGKNAHTWDGGSVSVPPGGEGGGVKTFTCTVCGAVREENLTNPGHTHVWGDSYEKDSGSHWLICTGCGEAGEKAAHRWNGGEVTVPPTQSTAGERQFACTVCGITRTEAIPPAGRPSGPSIPAKPTVPVGTDTPEENPPASENPENPDSADDPSAPEAPDRTEDKNPSAEPEEPEKTDDSAEPETPEQSGDSGQRDKNSADPEQSGTPGGTAVKDVRPGENAPGAVLATPIDELIGAVLTKEERQNLLDGADIRIILTVEDGTDSVPAEDKAAVEAVLAGLLGYRLGQYLDVSLLKIMGNVQEKITRTNRLITVTFEIPEALRKSGREYAVIRVHDGKAVVLGDLDNDENTVTIRTDRFSTYALVFSGEEENPPTGTALPALLPAALSAALTILTKRSKEKGKGK